MKIGIYGGTFNPPHLGHTQLAASICKTGIVDEIWLMVSPLNPLKREQQSHILPLDRRLRMAQLATQDIPCLRVSDFEAHLSLPSYTVRTLAALGEAYPQHQFSLIVGGDNWERFERWYQAETIRSTYDIIVYDRYAAPPAVHLHHPDGSSQTFTSLPDGTPFLLYPVSSTQIRRAIREGDTDFLRQWLHPNVLRYIEEEKVYQAMRE